MPMYDEMISAQVSKGYRSPLRGRLPSSTLGVFGPRRLSQGFIGSFTANTTTSTSQLFDLRLELDHECLRIAAGIDLDPRDDATSDVNSVRELAMYLSGALDQLGHPGRALFTTLQLRAFISSLALLHHSEVYALDPEPWDKLKTEHIPARFQTIAFQLPSNPTLAEEMRHHPNKYLIQLASQYFSFFRRGDSSLPSIVGPAINIVFASISIIGGQYNHTQQILQAFNQLLALRQRHQTRYEALCGLQDLVRLAASLSRQATLSRDTGQARDAAAIIVSTLLRKVDGILIEEDQDGPPRIGGQCPRLRGTFRRGPPDLDRAWYYYGLLDCAAQLTSLMDPGTVSLGFVDRMRKLILQSRSPEYRWKAIEILLSCPYTREKQYKRLRGELEDTLSSSAVNPTLQDTEKVLKASEIIREQLDSDEDAGLRFYVSQPLTDDCRLLRRDSSSAQISTSPVPSNIREVSVVSSPAPSVHSAPSETSWYERILPSSKQRKSHFLPLQFPRNGIRKPHSVGLSDNCDHVFFYNDTNISVFDLDSPKANSNKATAHPMIFNKRYKDECILHVACSSKWLCVLTHKRLITIDLTKDTKVSEIASTSHEGDWDFSGLACHETPGHLVTLLGQCRGNQKNGFQGQVKVFKSRTNGRAGLRLCLTIPLPDHDWPKIISYAADAQIVLCITGIQNEVLAWKVEDNFSSSVEILKFQKNKYAAETEETGITSASIYRSPSDRLYVLCTTAPSTERWRHKGEWSFIIPLPAPLQLPSTAIIQPPRGTIHNFEQFKCHRGLYGGCISSDHNIFAVLEKTGKIFMLSLDAHEMGGVYSAQEAADPLSPSARAQLCEQKRSGSAGLKFDPDGRLWAVDAKGRIIVTEFGGE